MLGIIRLSRTLSFAQIKDFCGLLLIMIELLFRNFGANICRNFRVKKRIIFSLSFSLEDMTMAVTTVSYPLDKVANYFATLYLTLYFLHLFLLH